MASCGSTDDAGEPVFQALSLHPLANLYAAAVGKGGPQIIEHLLIPALKESSYHFSHTLATHQPAVKVLTTTHDLYKIFERC